MAPHSDPRKQAEEHATRHRQRAGELYAEHRREGDPEILARANEENRQAETWERKAKGTEISGQTAPGNDVRGSGTRREPARGEAEEAEQSGWSDRRAWFLPGSVAEDPLLQIEEARGGGLLDELGKYAARSAFDKEHRTLDGAKLAGKSASAPIRAAAVAGRAVGRSVARAGHALSAPVQGATRGGRAILDAARRHKTGERGQDRQEVKRQGADRSWQRGRRVQDQAPRQRTRARGEREPER